MKKPSSLRWGLFLLYSIYYFVGMNFIRKFMIKTTWGPYWVMYDNECSFCYRITKRFKKFDSFNKIQWIDKNWKGDFPSEGRGRIEETVVVYNPSGSKLYFKSEAVSKIMLCVPFGFLFAWVLRIPGLSIFFDWLYDKISNNRNRITF